MRSPGHVQAVHREWRPIVMLWIIVIALLVVVVALAALSFAVHMLFSPLLLVIGIGVLAWLTFRRRRASR